MKKILLASVQTPSCIILLLTFILQVNNTVFAQPVNDNCATSTLLTSNTACANTAGTVVNATNSGVPVGTCTGNPNDDVWYRFTTVSTDHTIALSSIGSNLNTSGPRLQLFSGTCAGLVSVACGTNNITSTTLARGVTYYIRVYSAGAAAIATNGGFNICVTHPALVTPIIDFGKSYVNISKPTSGTVETGDVLEIRASVVVRAGAYDSCRFTDNIPAGTTYIPGTLSVLTNEGKIFRQFTDVYDDAVDDEGWITGSSITMNLGYRQVDNPATMTRRGRIRNNNGHKPSFYGSSCIMMASYRVTVNAAIGSTINTGGGTMTYTTSSISVNTHTFPSNTVAIYTNYGMCSNAIGANSIGTEFNGTFGSGPTRNRGTSANVPVGYTYSVFTTGGPNDYYYGIANNTSTRTNYSTSNAWPKPDNSSPSHRVFNVWDIIGDHTGATNQLLGNPAADTVANNNGGYMLIVNAAYRIDSAFQQTISNLCPNTYYEISCWMRNICSKCGCDSNGVGGSSGSASYIPTGPGDSSGVAPNITFEVDGVDYYTTGYINYTGQWVKRGFTILTGPAQTSFTLKFFNNAPGGGGNDWALDDISVATCLPNMRYSPSITPSICEGNPLTIYDTVRSYFNNYVYYKWQRSTDGGTIWTDVTAPSGPAIPFWNGTAWEYVTSYTIPPALTLPANSGDMYRLIVSTTLGNLSDPNCRSTDASNIVTLTVIPCGPPLDTKFISLTGKITNNQSILKWITATETEPLYYDVEKSANGNDFSIIGTISGYNDPGATQNVYSFTDPSVLNGKAYYRIRMRNTDGQVIYSRTIQLVSGTSSFAFVSVINPFINELHFDISSAREGIVKTELVDQFGKTVKRQSVTIQEGVSPLSFENTGVLPAGMYVLRAELDGAVIYKKVLKQHQ
ncbi:MAG: T9SS type A sorting domain-containing protein [Chitinophagaceae bacterium]|nr:T9SS type A sorting domain-containing protein [Chitinophagaceae bacterium]